MFHDWCNKGCGLWDATGTDRVEVLGSGGEEAVADLPGGDDRRDWVAVAHGLPDRHNVRNDV